MVASTLPTSPGVGSLSGDTGPGLPEMGCRRSWGLGSPLLLATPSLGSAPSQHRVQRAAAHLGSHGELRPPSSGGALRGQQPHVTEQGSGAGGGAGGAWALRCRGVSPDISVAVSSPPDPRGLLSGPSAHLTWMLSSGG